MQQQQQQQLLQQVIMRHQTNWALGKQPHCMFLVWLVNGNTLAMATAAAVNAACAFELHLQEETGNLLEGLSAALQHPHLSTHTQVLCAAARVCRGWREAVRQCSACNTVVVLGATSPLQRLQSLAQWLGRHAGLLSSITVHPASRQHSYSIDGMPYEEHLKAAQHLLQRSLHAATVPLPQAVAAAGAESAAVLTMEGLSLQQQCQQQQQQQQGLRLRSFSSSLPKAVDMLAVLHPHSLTSLDLNLRRAATDSATLSRVLERLRSLQQLRISNMCEANLWSALPVLAQICHLTSLELSGASALLSHNDWYAHAHKSSPFEHASATQYHVSAHQNTKMAEAF
jgi:hypothetical protein